MQTSICKSMGIRFRSFGVALLAFVLLGAATALHAQLATGSYTVGSDPGADYATIDDAVAALSSGVSGPVMFRIQSGVYAPPGSGYWLTEQPGMSLVNTVTFKPDDGATVLISGSVSYGAIFHIDGGDNYVIDGSNSDGGTTRDLTIINTSTDYASAVVIDNDADYNVVRYSVLQSASYSYSPSYGAIVTFGGGGNDYNSIASCIIGDPVGLTRANCGVYSYGSDQTQMNTSDSVINCEIVNFGTADIDYNQPYGVYVGSYNSGMIVAGNEIHMNQQPFYYYVQGVSVDESNGYSVDTRVERNRIHDILAGTDLYGYGYSYGLYYNGSSAAGTTLSLNNNMVSFQQDGNVYGNAIYLDMSWASNSSTVDIYHNTVRISGTTSGYEAHALYIANYDGSGGGQTTFNHKNNLYDINRPDIQYGWYLEYVGISNWNSDYNLVNFNTNGGNFVYQYNENPYEYNINPTLGDYQSSTGLDQNSLSGQVTFADPTAGDLHQIGGCTPYIGESRGTPIPWVSNDLDDAPRDGMNPDIGADEGSFNGDGIRVIAPVASQATTSAWNMDVNFTATRPMSVAIDISTDGGASWANVGNVNPTVSGPNTATVMTPYAETANAQVRVVSTDNVCEGDTSENFQILNPSFTLLLPNGGERLIAGDVVPINWLSRNVPPGLTVDLELSTDAGASWQTISSGEISNNAPATNSYSWTVPNFPTTDALVRVVASGRTEADSSNAPFQILATPNLTILSPNGGEGWYIGESDTIRWTAVTSDYINIEYSVDAGATWMPIIMRIPSFLGSLPWTVPNAPSDMVLVRITDNQRPSVVDVSDNLFSILPSDIHVLTPNGGEKFALLQPVTVSWTAVNATPLRIDYSSDNGATWETVAPSIPSALGSYTFTPTPMPTKLGLVRLVSVDHPRIKDQSDMPFEIMRDKGITIYTPTTGDRVVHGSVTPILWDAYQVDRVNVLFSSNAGADWQTLASNVEAVQGHFVWSVPMANTTQAKIRIQEVGGPVVSESGIFSIIDPIRPTLMLARPNGGESYQEGSPVTILWSAVAVQSLSLSYSSNSGTSWTLIASGVSAGKGQYKWTAPNSPGTHYRVRINAPSLAAGDTSDADFTVTARPIPTIVLLHPNGGEQFTVDSMVTVRWNATNLTGNVRLKVSTDNGGTWKEFATVPVTPSEYNWMVPDMPSAQTLVRVESADGSVGDNSDAPFKVIRRISAPMLVVSPNGGEVWRAGEADTIVWTAPETVTAVNIDLSVDGGANWATIQSNVVSIGTGQNKYLWTVPNLPNNTSSALVRVRDAANGSMFDLSDRVFRITNATGGVDNGAVAGLGLSLSGNYPNPFASQTDIRWMQGAGGNATLRIFTQAGAVVGSYDLGYRNGGNQAYLLDARDLPNGGYIYELRVGTSVQRQVMLLVR